MKLTKHQTGGKMIDIVEAERIALAMVLKLVAYKRELVNRNELTPQECRDFSRLSEVGAVLKGAKVMQKQKGNGELFAIGLAGAASWFILAASGLLMSGCFYRGTELAGRIGIYPVDERQDSSKTYGSPVPWKCYFVNCGSVTAQPVGGES